MTQVVIVGAAETEKLGTIPDQSALSLAIEPTLAALKQAGLTLTDVDGVAGTLFPTDLAHGLGIRSRWMDGTMVGGCSNLLHVRHAVAAIQSGMASVVAVMHGESNRSRIGAPAFVQPADSVAGQFELPYGVTGTFSRLGLTALAYFHKYGWDIKDLAQVPVAQSRWASRNPRASRPKLLTVEDVLASKLIAWPFHVLECCPLNDGGGALILTSAERAKDLNLQYRPVVVAGTGESCEAPGVAFMEDLTSFRGFRDASADAMRTAGVTHKDVDHLMVYDPYAHLPLYGLEDAGFVKRGEAIDFIKSGATSPGGSLPMNTNGGGLLYAHTGMYGIYAMQEAVRQLQGRAAAQLDKVETSLVLGLGMMFQAAGAVVLRRA